MHELDPHYVNIQDAFWTPRLEMNARAALPHQWQQLEASGCIDNFRLVAGRKEGVHTGWFFADSDAYKWLDAACRVLATRSADLPVETRQHIDTFVDLIRATQDPDGYLYTYNQLLFPGVRWTNLQIEHELYCHGHLIEAALAHHQATGARAMLDVATRAADLLVQVFGQAGPEGTPGHQEIEIALIKLARITIRERYLDLAQAFIERRGRVPRFAAHIFQQNRDVDRRSAQADASRAAFRARQPEATTAVLPETNAAPTPRGIQARFMLSALSGRYFQQHRPVRQQTVPVGHAVRFAYLEAATAMLARVRGDGSLRPALEAAWSHLVERRMHVTGGAGSLPVIEGFGRDYELDPEVAYAETCAALGCLFWNWEMTLLSGQAPYADLFEWQLYNAAGVGMGLEGQSYLYNNPLACRGGVTRRAWYEVPCCPSDLSRTWAHLGRYLYSTAPGSLWVHQYIGSRTRLAPDPAAELEVASALPGGGRVTLHFRQAATTAPFTVYLRMPGWAGPGRVTVNGQPVRAEPPIRPPVPQTASGVTPQAAWYLPLERSWAPGDVVEIEFVLPVLARRAHPRVRRLRGRVALTRGPLVFCLESVDNPGLDLFAARLDPATFRAEFESELLGGVWVLRGRTRQGQPCTAIPYYAWANRGPSQMTVWVRV